MESKQFQEQAIRTDIEDYKPVQERLLENSSSLTSCINGFILSTSAMDIMKKKIMYNSNPMKLLELDAKLAKEIKEFPSDFVEKISQDELLSQLLHYSVGTITELLEIIMALGNAVKTGELDRANMGEELGDSLYYLSVMATRLGLPLESIMETNNKKLKARYPNKFTEESANERDLEAERKILEG